MADTRKNRARSARPSLVELEDRLMADGKTAAVFVGPMPLAAVSRPVPVEVSKMSTAQPPAIRATAQAAVSSFQYTAITIKNSTRGTVNYTFRWGNGATTKYSLTPGQQRVHYIRSQNQKATIAFDKSFSAGVQEQRYSLTGRNIVRRPGFYLVEPTPSVGEGKLYTFRSVTNGVQLYSS